MDLGRFKKEKTAKQTWLDWLSDTPPPLSVQDEVRKRRVEQASSYVSRPVVAPNAAKQSPRAVHDSKIDPPAGGLSINITLPELHRPQFKRVKVLLKRVRPYVTRGRIIRFAVVLLIVGTLWTGLSVLKHRGDQRISGAKSQQSSSNATAVGATPSFVPIVPSTKQELITADGKHSKYDASKGSYDYIDTIAGKQFTVSEQQIPSGQKDTDVVSKAARSVSATVTLTTGWGSAYLNNNQKYNSQILVFSIKGILIFISSSFTLSNQQWTDYINSLQ